MKKKMVALCTAVLLLTTGCQKDNPAPVNPAPQQDNREGVYMPEQKVDTILINGQIAEVWTWESNKLQSVRTPNENGVLTESSTFNYNGNRLTSMMTSLRGMPMQVSYSYGGDYLNSITVSNSSTQLLGIDVQHTGDKIQHADFDINSDYLADILNLIDPQMIPDSMTIDVDSMSINVGNLYTLASGLFTSIENLQASADLQWQGQNVSAVLLNVSFTAGTTLGDVLNVIGDLSIFGQYASILAMMPATTPLSMQIALCDTSDYFYDQMHNPFQKYLGRIDVSALSANNVQGFQHSGIMNLIVYVSIMGTQVPIWNSNFPIPSNYFNYMYEYDGKGYPVRMIDIEGNTTEYKYKD